MFDTDVFLDALSDGDRVFVEAVQSSMEDYGPTVAAALVAIGLNRLVSLEPIESIAFQVIRVGAEMAFKAGIEHGHGHM